MYNLKLINHQKSGPDPMVSLHLHVDAESLRPLIEAILRESHAMPLSSGSEPLNRMLSEPEAAELFGVEPCVLRDARRRGELEAHRIGRYVRYDQAQLHAWKQRTRITGSRATSQPASGAEE